MRRALLAAILVTLALQDLCAQITDTQQQRGALSGTVTDSITELPIQGATVLLRGTGTAGGESASATTNSEGRFTLEGLSPGRYRVWASHVGYANQRGIGSGPSRQMVALGPGQRIDDLNVRLAPGSIVSGHITDGAGRPLRGVSVQAMKRSYRQGRSDFPNVASVLTNAAGEYRIADLARGEYYLRASYAHPPTVKPKKPKEAEAYIPLYYPGTGDLEHSVALMLREGEQLPGIDLQLAPARVFRVKGRVINGITSLAAKGSRVTLVGDHGKLTFSPTQPTIGASGTFEFRGVPSGSYSLEAEQPAIGPHDKDLWGRVAVQVGDLNVDDVEAIVSPGVEVSGRVRVEGNGAVNLSHLMVELESRDASSTALTLDAPNASVSSDGTFLLDNVPEGSYGVNVFPVPSGFYLNENGEDVIESGITVGRGYASASLELTLSPALGRIDGTVSNSDEPPRAGILVLLVPGGVRRSQPRYYRQAVTDQSGRFALQGIAPGDYRLFAGEDVAIADFMNLDPSLQFDQGTTVHVDNETHVNVQLEELGSR
jgi:protocatechuate 3,4-dioxygenase beta subunit